MARVFFVLALAAVASAQDLQRLNDGDQKTGSLALPNPVGVPFPVPIPRPVLHNIPIPVPQLTAVPSLPVDNNPGLLSPFGPLGPFGPNSPLRPIANAFGLGTPLETFGRPGLCPYVSRLVPGLNIDASVCGNLCLSDNACSATQKCCPTECGYACFDTVHIAHPH